MNKVKPINYNYFKELSSTNDKLLSMLDFSGDFTVVYTFNQTKGKGFGTNKWISEPNKNLTFSFLLNLNNKKLDNLIYLNFWLIGSLHKFFKKKYLVNNDLQIKWPNDLILNQSKIAGILIENKIQKNNIKSIIGIGINVNQLKFNNLPNASSIFKETGLEINIEELLFELMDFLYVEYSLFFNEKSYLLDYYNQYLFKKDKVACFEKDNHIFNAIIKQVSENGELQIIDENYKLINFKHKEVKLLF